MPLGCTDSVEAFLLPRGGGRPLLTLPFSTYEWRRSLDETSTASVTIAGPAAEAGSDCCAELAAYDPWEVELGIYRNHQRVWAGPVDRDIVYNPESIAISASDLSIWLTRRRVHNRHPTLAADDDVAVDACTLAEALIADGLSVDSSMHLRVEILAAGPEVVHVVKARENKMVASEISSLAESDIDWTVIDRTMYVAGAQLPFAPFATLVDEHFADISGPVTVSGARLVTRQTITGQGSGADGPAVQATVTADAATEERYGVHESVASDDSIRREARARRAAQTRIDLLGEPAVTFTGGTLDADFPIALEDLRPGTIFAVRVNSRCREVVGNYRLTSVSARGDADSHEISVEMAPVGTEGVDG